MTGESSGKLLSHLSNKSSAQNAVQTVTGERGVLTTFTRQATQTLPEALLQEPAVHIASPPFASG